MTIAIDYSFSHPLPSAIKAAGVDIVIRYASHNASKNLTRTEAEGLHYAGLGIAIVWETSTGRVNSGGASGGAADAHDANVFADALGYPKDCPIFYACDAAPNGLAARDYFSGVKAITSNRPIGWYGGMGVGISLHAIGLVDFVWVANAASWSGFKHWNDLAPMARKTPGVSMLQSINRDLPGLDPSAYDLDEIIQDFPTWGRPIDNPPNSITTTIEDDDVKITEINAIKLDIAGNGNIAAPAGKTLDVLVIGGSEPNVSHQYDKAPNASLSSDRKVIVLQGGVPLGTYTVLVLSA